MVYGSSLISVAAVIVPVSIAGAYAANTLNTEPGCLSASVALLKPLLMVLQVL